MRNAVVVAFVAVAALAACNKQEEQMGLVNWQKAPPLLAGVDEGATPDAPGAQGGPGRAAVLPAAAPGTVPVRKAGLWQTTINTGRGQPQSGQLCVSDESELRRNVFSQTGGRGGPGCEPKIAKGQNGAWTLSMSCTRAMGDIEIKTASNQTLTGDLATKYQVKGTSTTSGGPNPDMNGTRQISATGSYVGACPAGMKPGDFKGADGQVRNLLEQGQGRGFGGPGGREGRPGGGRPQAGGAPKGKAE